MLFFAPMYFVFHRAAQLRIVQDPSHLPSPCQTSNVLYWAIRCVSFLRSSSAQKSAQFWGDYADGKRGRWLAKEGWFIQWLWHVVSPTVTGTLHYSFGLLLASARILRPVVTQGLVEYRRVRCGVTAIRMVGHGSCQGNHDTADAEGHLVNAANG